MIAITGAQGLLGSAIARRFLQDNIPVVGIRRSNSDLSLADDIKDRIIWRDADILDTVALSDAMKDIHTVIHTAAMVSFNPRESKQLFNVNVRGTAHVVDACLLHGVKRLMHVSSVAALGIQKDSAKTDEAAKWVNNPLQSDYAESKYLAELEVARGYEEGLHTVIINPSVILAPGNRNKSSAKLFDYVLREKSFYIEGMMNYVDARDVAELIMRLYHTDHAGERYIASAGHIPIKTFFDDIATRLRKKAPSVSIPPAVAHMAAVLEGVRSFITGKEPLFTKQMLRAGREQTVFENKKSIAELGIQYRSLENTLDWCCEFYLRDNTINKQ